MKVDFVARRKAFLYTFVLSIFVTLAFRLIFNASYGFLYIIFVLTWLMLLKLWGVKLK